MKVTMETASTSRKVKGKFPRGMWWIQLWTGILLLKSTECQEKFNLITVVNYTVFSGDIPVKYVIPFNITLPEASIELVSLKDETIVATTPIPVQAHEAEVSILCGTLDHAGQYVFRMRERADTDILIESPVINAYWPRSAITLPSTHTALTTQITMHVNVEQTQCESAHGNSKYWIEVVYYGNNDTYFGSNPEPKQYIMREEVRRLSYLKNVPKVLSCDILDQGGVYQGRLQSAYDNSVALSDIMHVHWSLEYSLTTLEKSIFPCERNFIVQYSQPGCSGDNDKIRLYQQKQSDSTIISPITLEYMSERRARKNTNIAHFPCNKFDINAYGYCFKYVSTAKSGAVHEQKAKCVPTEDIPVVNGNWGSWSQWSACTTSCGLGNQNRYRMCDNPPPSQGGMFCQDSSTEIRHCENICTVPTSQAPLYTPDPSCVCGCEVLTQEGRIISSFRCPGSSLWTIRATKGEKIRLIFEIFDLVERNRGTWLKVRDGDSLSSELIVHSYGGGKPADTVSTHNSMLIEFFTPYDRGSGFVQAEGFVAKYKVFVDNSTQLGAAPAATKHRVWAHTVTIVGITLCVAIIIGTVAFVCHNRRIRRLKKEKRAQQALLNNGEVANSPTHSFQGSTNLSFGSPAGSPTKREYVVAKGVSTQPSTSNSDIGSHILQKKSKATGAIGGREVGGSRKSSQSSRGHRKGSAGTPGSHYHSPIPSPYAANANPNDFCHDPDTFRVSPIPPDESYPKGHHHRHRRRPPPHSPPVSPTRGISASHGSRSPTKSMGSLGSGSMGSANSRSRSKNYKDSVPQKKSPRGAPIADLEDLSPMYSSPKHKPYNSPNKMAPINENKSMDYYNKDPRKKSRGANVIEVQLEQRPPVEGRDSLTRKKKNSHHTDNETSFTKIRGPTMPDRQNANVPDNHRPHIKPLPLRSVQRPDGQSPENRPIDPNANTPVSQTSGLSPVLQKENLFPENSSRTPSEIVFMGDQEFEYDDYIPELPGSYFTMDPHAYTLTWSQQPPWAQQKGVSQAASMASIRTNEGNNGDRNTSNC